MGTAIKHTVPDRVKLSFVIFDVCALWRISAQMSKITNDGLTSFIAVPIWQQFALRG